MEALVEGVKKLEVGPRVVVYEHPDCVKHIQSETHVEAPDRVKVIHTALTKMEPQVEFRQGRLATEEEISRVHTTRLIDKVRRVCTDFKGKCRFKPDVQLCEDSFQAACAAAGCVLSAVEDVLAGRATRAFCNIRPPGHHANQTTSDGFCIFNNVAVGVRELQRRGFKNCYY
jgi:acetoin utilization deacetylase AcuC-like enzyme